MIIFENLTFTFVSFCATLISKFSSGQMSIYFMVKRCVYNEINNFQRQLIPKGDT